MIFTDSILNTVKKGVGYDTDYDPFDDELIIHINGILNDIYQLGYGTKDFSIHGASETWEDFFNDNPDKYGDVIQFVVLSVRLAHDPPTNSFLVSAIEKRLSELSWRINVSAEEEVRNE